MAPAAEQPWRPVRPSVRLIPERRTMPHDPTILLLLYFVMPLWLLAGFADWLCHRRSDIAHTACV